VKESLAGQKVHGTGAALNSVANLPGLNMKSSDTSCYPHLRTAQKWLELGNLSEASLALETLAPEFQRNSDVLKIRWQIYAKESKWNACLDTAHSMTVHTPDCWWGWVCMADAVHRCADGTIHMARDILLSVVEKFPQEPIIAYNLACYCCQLKQLKDARKWLDKAIKAGGEQIRGMALCEPDLEPLWAAVSPA